MKHLVTPFLTIVTCAALVAGCGDGEDGPGGGSGKADGWNGQDAKCASQRFLDLLDAVGPVIEEGGTPADVAFSENNFIHTQPYIQGPAIFTRMSELIETAEHDVLFETYEFTPEAEPFQLILEGLSRLNARRIQEGHSGPPVRVYMMITQIVTTGWRMKDVWTMVDDLALDTNHVQVVLAHWYDTALGINHGKLLVVDGRVAIVTGANASEEHGGDEVYWDAGYELEGEVAYSLHRTFNYGWTDMAGVWVCEDEDQWDRENANDCWHSADEIPIPPTAGRTPNGEELCEPMFVAVSETSNWPFPQHEYDQPMTQAFLSALNSAEREILLHTPNLNEPLVMETLESAARAGIDVKVVLSLGHLESGEAVPGRGGTNLDAVEAIHKSMEDMPDACDRLQIHWYTTVDGEVPHGSGAPNSHLKFLAVDGEMVIIGSCNMDIQSWHNSREIIVVVDNPEVTQQWTQQVFDPSWARSTLIDQCR